MKTMHSLFVLLCLFIVVSSQASTNPLLDVIANSGPSNSTQTTDGKNITLQNLKQDSTTGLLDAITYLLNNNNLGEILENVPFAKTLMDSHGISNFGITDDSISNKMQSLSEDTLGQMTGDSATGEVLLLPYVFVAALQANGVSESCRNDFGIIFTNLVNRTNWALQLIDAMGKPESGLLEGNVKWLGNYQECVNIKAVTGGVQHFTGKYCNVGIPAGSFLPPQFSIMGAPKIQLGTCVPSSCSAGEIKTLITSVQTLLLNGTTVIQPDVSCKEARTLPTDTIVCICVLAMLLAFVVFGTLYDVIAVQMKPNNNDEKSEKSQLNGHVAHRLSRALSSSKPGHTDTAVPKAYTNGGYLPSENGITETKLDGVAATDSDTIKIALPPNEESPIVDQPVVKKQKGIVNETAESILLAFSFYSNGVKILNTTQGAGTLGAINGIRFLSMAWVILGHTYYFCIGYDKNLLHFYKTSVQHWSFMAIPYAGVSVDSFFALSGILVAYLTLRELKKVGGIFKLNWSMFYFHRFWRLTPPYMLVIMVGTLILPYVLNGPMWTDDEFPFMDNCRDNWWTNLLYINNYVKTDKICLGWSWYLSNDMQFYIISPMILLPLFYNAIAGVASSAIFLTATTVATGVVAYKHKYSAQLMTMSEFVPKPTDGDYMANLYLPSYARLGPYVVGLFTGYLLYKMNCKCRIPKIINLVCWFLCIAVCCLCVYSPFIDNGKHVLTPQESTAFFALHRTGWGIAVCWIVFACATGYGGWIDQVLSWKAFVPLGRLTYSAYLIHPLVMLVFYSSRNSTTYFSNYEVIYLFLGNITMSYGIGFIVSLLFESPMMGLEKALFKKGRK